MQPDLILVPFAQDAPSANIDEIPVSLGPSDPPQAASYSQGFPNVTMTPLAAGGIPPRGQSFNGIFYDITKHVVYIGRGGQYKWSDASVAATGGYSIGDVVQADDGSASYVSTINNNNINFNTNPGSIGASWKAWAGNSPIPWSRITGKPTTLEGYGITNALVVNRTSQQRPSLSAPVLGAGNDGGALQIREALENGSANTSNEYAPRINFQWAGITSASLSMISDGRLLWGENVIFTTGNFNPAAKADVNSPAFTGIPTTPDVAAGASSSQIANTKFVSDSISSIDPWANQPIGVPIPVFDDLLSSLAPPTNKSAYRYVKLTASDSYNSGVLSTESVTGSAPLVLATAIISLAGSPLSGKTIRLMNTERRVLRAGNSGTIEQDAFQHHNHAENVGTSNTASTVTDTLNSYASGLSAAGAYSQRLPTATGLNNVAIGGPISSVTGGTVRTDTETRAKSVGVTYYMRIK